MSYPWPILNLYSNQPLQIRFSLERRQGLELHLTDQRVQQIFFREKDRRDLEVEFTLTVYHSGAIAHYTFKAKESRGSSFNVVIKFIDGEPSIIAGKMLCKRTAIVIDMTSAASSSL